MKKNNCVNVGGGLVSESLIFSIQGVGGESFPLFFFIVSENYLLFIILLSNYYHIFIILLSYLLHFFALLLPFFCLFFAWNSHFLVWNSSSFTYSPLIKHLKQRIQALRQSLLFSLHFICFFLSLFYHFICILIALFYHYYVKMFSPCRLYHSPFRLNCSLDRLNLLFLGL